MEEAGLERRRHVGELVAAGRGSPRVAAGALEGEGVVGALPVELVGAGAGVREEVVEEDEVRVARHSLAEYALEPEELSRRRRLPLEVEREVQSPAGAVEARAFDVVGRLEDEGSLGAARVSAEDGAAEVTEDVSVGTIVERLVEHRVVGRHLGEDGDHAAVEVRLADAPDRVSGGYLSLRGFGGSDGDGPDVGLSDEALRVAEVHRVLHSGGDFGRVLRGRLAAHEVLKQRSAETVEERFLQVGHAGLLVDVGAEVRVGAEEVERTALLVFYRADAEPALVVAGADEVLRALRVEHLVDLALGELHYAVGVLVVDAGRNEEVLRGGPYSVGEVVVLVDDRVSVVLDVVFLNNPSDVGDEGFEHPLSLVFIERAVVCLREYFPHSER